MPRFSETEKEIIRERLLREGERLFTAHGIKKVSIDELVQATGIAKGSFYAFFQSKELLFMEIVSGVQNRMWVEMEGFLQAHARLRPRELMKETFTWMLGRFECYPLLLKMDNETINYLFRKLPREVVEAHTREDGEELLKLREYGVTFNCDIPTAAKIMQTLALSFFSLAQEDEATRMAVANTMLDGVLKEIVREEA